LGGVKDHGKRNLLGVLVAALDYDAAVAKVLGAAREGRGLTVAALAVHGVMTGVRDPSQRHRLNRMDIATPDGQPVRWALNMLHGVKLSDQVRGTTLSLRVLQGAADEGLPVFFYGSRTETLDKMVEAVRKRVPALEIAGYEESKFRTADRDECAQIATRIKDSGARLAFIGLGCPRQEQFLYFFRDLLPMPALAVGAAFDYLAGNLPEPPDRMRRMGLEWLWRLGLEPRRLWRRYLLLNPAYLTLLALQLARAWRPDTSGAKPKESVVSV
jgi:N-acetylglucosaminyldiphosphoundecaprenol N-acetyl-beta-D-mannosaminyltransferase